MPRVFILSSETPGSAAPPQELGQTVFARFDLRYPWWYPNEWIATRRAMLGFAPDLLHCNGLQALRMAALLNHKMIPFVYSGVPLEKMDRFTRRYAAKGTALVSTEAEREQLNRVGLRAERIPVGVAEPAVQTALSRECDAQVILFGGKLNHDSVPLQAVWAFDCLKYALPEAQIVFFGSGPKEAEIRRISFGLGFDDFRVRFAAETERSARYQRGGVVWLTRAQGGATEALDALARGLPVLAMRTWELEEYASEGLSLVPAGDRIALAAATLKVLGGPRPAIPTPRFPIGAMVQKYAAVYDAMAGSAA